MPPKPRRGAGGARPTSASLRVGAGQSAMKTNRGAKSASQRHNGAVGKRNAGKGRGGAVQGGRVVGGGDGSGSARRSHGQSSRRMSRRSLNVYSADDDAEKPSDMERFKDVDVYEYELPDEFEDEEIDEEAAFGADEDAEMYMAPKRDGPASRRRAQKPKEDSDIDMSETERPDISDGDDSEEMAGAVDIGELLDDDEGDGGAAKAQKGAKGPSVAHEEAGESAEDEEEDESDGERHGRLLDAIATMDGKRSRKRRLDERSEAYRESEFNLNPKAGDSAGVVGVNDLLSSLGDDGAGYGGLKKKLARLEKDAAPLSVPLAKPAAERIERAVAYDAMSKEVSKWVPTVKANREAEHLSFPLNTPTAGPNVTSVSLAATFKPETQMEAEVHALLSAAGGDKGDVEKKLMEAEQLALNELTVEEARARRHELQKMRAVLSYYEEKCRRIRRIKSKKYHKVKNRALQRKGAALQEGDIPLDSAGVSKAERARVEERMTLRHKNKSKWAKRMLARGGGLDQGTREAIAEQLRIGDELRKKITLEGSDEEGEGSGDNDDDEGGESGASGEDEEGVTDSEAEDGDASDGASRKRPSTKTTLEGLSTDLDAQLPVKGLFGLKFMQRAIEKKRSEARQMLAELRDELGTGEGGEKAAPGTLRIVVDDSGGDFTTEAVRSSAALQKAKKGLTGKAPPVAQGESSGEESESEDEEVDADARDDYVRMQREEKRAAKETQPTRRAFGSATSNTAAPSTTSATSANKAQAATTASANATPAKTAKPLATPAQATADEPSESDDDSDARGDDQGAGMGKEGEDDAEENPWIVSEKGADKKEEAAPAKRKRDDAAAESNGVRESEAARKRAKMAGVDALLPNAVPPQKAAAKDKTKGVAFDLSRDEKQRELVKMAFAGDDVVREFEEEKRALVDSETPKDEDVTIPGWGHWGGEGAPAPKRRFVKPAPPREPRKDDALKHVIINEKLDKKSTKLQVGRVPHPFNSAEQFERALRNPVGKEWNTSAAFAKAVQRKVSTRAGTVIDPIRTMKKG